MSKNTQKGSNYHNRDSSMLKFIPELTTIGAHIVSKFQPCAPNISEVIVKSILVDSFQDPPKTHKKHTNFDNKGDSQLKFRGDHYRCPYCV